MKTILRKRIEVNNQKGVKVDLNELNTYGNKSILFSNTNVMCQSSHNNRRMKQGFMFPTPQTRLEQRPSLYQEGDLCLQHSSPLEVICHSCEGKLLCSQCLLSAVHSGHQVRSIERARQMIFSQYQEWMIRLSSKSEIFDIIHVQFEREKSQIILLSKQYKESLSTQFTDIIRLLQNKLEELLGSIDSFIIQYIKQMSKHMEDIRKKQKEIEKLITTYDKDSIDQVMLSQLASYSYENKGKISELLDENDISYLKEQLVKPEWSISNDVIKQIRNAINAISINFKEANLRQPKILLQQEKIKKKSKKDLRLDINQRENSQYKLKQSSSKNPFFQSTLTPKNKSKQKKVKQKRSPEVQLLKKRKKSSAKMISMPASPAKEVQSTYLITPQLSRKKIFKKK